MINGKNELLNKTIRSPWEYLLSINISEGAHQGTTCGTSMAVGVGRQLAGLSARASLLPDLEGALDHLGDIKGCRSHAAGTAAGRISSHAFGWL